VPFVELKLKKSFYIRRILNKRILIVEDDLALIRALADKFLSEGFDVLEAKNGEEGLVVALQENPDLILLDIVMPRMDGLTMLKELRNDERGQEVPVIVLSNLTDTAKTADMVDEGVMDYLIKSDWKLEDVVKKVKQTLGI